MSKCNMFFAFGVFLFVVAGPAEGTLVSFESDALSTWSPAGAVISEGLSSLGPASVTISAESLSKFTITTTATNESGFVWTGYRLMLDPAEPATFVPGSAGSTKFGTVDEVDDWTLEFWAPLEVLPGQVVTMQFDVSIPDGGAYTFTLTQEPIPEPSTVAILSLGALPLLLRKRN